MDRSNGFTVFHFDFNPKLTRRNLTLGEAVRCLQRATGTRIGWWRCPMRGLAIQYRKLPTTSYSYDQGESYRILVFSALTDVVEAKKALALDLLLQGIELYRALPNRMFDDEIRRVRWLLQAPPSVSAEDWRQALAQPDRRVQPLLRTHEAEPRHHLLGEKYTGPTGTIALTVRTRLEAMEPARG